MPAHRYYSADGSAVPSVSTIKSQLGWASRGLMIWANREGLAGRDINERQSAAADVGTVAHAAIEAEIKGWTFDLSAATAHMQQEQREQVDRCLVAWARWKEQTRLEVLESEASLVSEAHRFGGTLDCLAVVGGAVSLLDLKTGNGMYPDHLVQIAAYGELLREARGVDVADYHLLRLGKETGAFHHTSIPAASLECAWDAFLAARQLYDLQSKLRALT